MDCLVLSLLARPSPCLKRWDLLYETVVVFSLPAFSGETILSAAFRLYKLQHVLAKDPPFLKRQYITKRKRIPILFIEAFLLDIYVPFRIECIPLGANSIICLEGKGGL